MYVSMFFTIAALASATIALADEAILGGPSVPASDRNCSATGTKCAGILGYPLVAFSACCDPNYICGYPLSPGTTWGRYWYVDREKLLCWIQTESQKLC
jgi:hypothetical protein